MIHHKHIYRTFPYTSTIREILHKKTGISVSSLMPDILLSALCTHILTSSVHTVSIFSSLQRDIHDTRLTTILYFNVCRDAHHIAQQQLPGGLPHSWYQPRPAVHSRLSPPSPAARLKGHVTDHYPLGGEHLKVAAAHKILGKGSVFAAAGKRSVRLSFGFMAIPPILRGQTRVGLPGRPPQDFILNPVARSRARAFEKAKK